MTEKDCQCGHQKIEHVVEPKGVTKLGFLGDGFFRTTQLERGICSKCTCPKYKPPKFLKSKKTEYSPRDIPNFSESRCGKCGRLLENHENAGHEFRE